MRIVGIILVVFALVLGLLLALATLLLPDSASNDTANRAVEHSAVFGLAPQQVQLDLALSQYAQCQQGARPLDVVVLIDQSGSMGGEPLTQAVAGAQAFIDTLDLSMHRVALALFSDQVNAYQGLTSDRTALAAALAQASANSGTNIANALTAARNELQGTRRRFGSAGFIVLFTDGGTDSSTIPEVETLAKSAQDAGIKLFVIGLRGDDYNEPLLRAVASGPDYLRLAPPVEEIPAAFRSIAEEINQVVATDLRVVESVDTGLTVDPASVAPQAEVTSQQILWQAPALNQDALAEWATLGYQVAPTGYGFRRLAPQEARLTFNDCNNQVVAAALPAGPRVLFLPPAPLLLLPLLLLLIPGLLLIALGGRKPKPGPISPRPVAVPLAPETEPATPAPAPSATEGTLIMDWLGKVESLSPETGRTPNAPMRALPTLIIGLGASGRVVLQKIAADLQDRWGPTLPERVRLLQINVPLGNPAPTDVLPNLLEVNLARSGDLLNKGVAHLEWARNVSTRTGRPAGRMALFADLGTSKSESQLHPALRKVLSGQRQTTVWIVADAFSDDGSSIVADLAHLVRTLALPEEISSVRLCLAMHNARWSDRLGPQQRSARAFATLRELQRLRQKREVPFIYAPGYGQRELEATSAGRIFDEVYLFDGKGEQVDDTSYDVSALPAGEGVLEVIAAGLTAFLDPALSQRFLELEKNAQSEVARTGSARLENYVSAMGCCTVSVPVEEIRRLAELRLAHRALFDVEDGLFGWERLERTGDLAQRKQARVDVSARDLAAFQQATGLGGEVSASQPPAGQARAKVRAYLDQVMNDGEPLRLRWANALLEQMVANQPDVGPILDPFLRELGEWIKLVGQVAAPTTAKTQQTTSDVDLGFEFSFDLDLPSFELEADNGAAGALYQQWERHWQQARESFPVFKAQSPHTSVATLADEAAIFERYLPRPGQEAARLRRRVYWLWQERQGYMTLQLLVLPNDLTAKPAGERFRTWGDVLRDNPYAYASSPRDVDAVLDGLLAAARAQSRGINAESITLYLGRQSGSLTQTLQRNSSPLFRRKEIGGGGEGVAATPYRYLLAPAADAGDQLATNLKAMRFVGSDPATVVMMQVKHILPIVNTVAYDEALHAYIPTRNDQVFLAEQIAAEMENAARQEALEEQEALRLPPDVVAMLEQSQESVELLGEAMVYGLLEIHPARGGVTVTATSSDAQPLAALGANRLLMEGAPLLHNDGQWRQRLQTAVDELRTSLAERRYELLNQVRLHALPPLLALPSGDGQELGIVLAAAIQRESVRV